VVIEANNFEKITIERWIDLEEFNKPKWIYRGQRNANRIFKSSLERLCDSLGIDLLDAHVVEKSIVCEFKRKFHQYSTYIPDKDDNLEWLSIMRHYMAPTRLLDWNYSIYIALYFALEQACDEEYAVWCLNSKWAYDESRGQFLKHGKGKGDVENICDKPSYGQDATSFTNIFLHEPFVDTVFPISPRLITERITVQKGLFLCPGNPKYAFSENIKNMNKFNDKKNIIRLVIPKRKRKEYLAKLYGMNITHATLFPGLDGFAYSLAVYHQSFEKKSLEQSLHRKDDCAWT